MKKVLVMFEVNNKDTDDLVLSLLLSLNIFHTFSTVTIVDLK